MEFAFAFFNDLTVNDKLSRDVIVDHDNQGSGDKTNRIREERDTFT